MQPTEAYFIFFCFIFISSLQLVKFQQFPILISLAADDWRNVYTMAQCILLWQSELPRPIPRNSMESDHGCTSRTYYDNAGVNMRLTLYNVTLTSRNHVNTITSVIAAKQTV